MNSIKESLKYIIEAQKNIGYPMPNFLKPGATDQEIEKAERETQMKFNDELRELFKSINGIRVRDEPPSGLTGIIPIHDLLGLKDAAGYSSLMDWENHELVYSPRLSGHKFFPFLHDGGGNCYWVDLNKGSENHGRLYWTNTFGDEPGYLFNSLTDFFNAIKTGYKNGIFMLDEEGYLDCDYDQWGKICHDLDKSITYWKEYVEE